jgi:hypothetical protein
MIRKRGSHCSQDDDEESAAFLNDTSLSKQPKTLKTDDATRNACLFSTVALSITVLVYLLVHGTIQGRCHPRGTMASIVDVPSPE